MQVAGLPLQAVEIDVADLLRNRASSRAVLLGDAVYLIIRGPGTARGRPLDHQRTRPLMVRRAPHGLAPGLEWTDDRGRR